MIVVPALDLREGACVQLIGGDYSAERVRFDDPLEVARRWIQAGFRRLHVVDLDAATGRGGNRAMVQALLDQGGALFQVGGGIRNEAEADHLLRSGAERVVCGTRAITDPDWRRSLGQRHPGRIVIAADVRGRDITTDGWSRSSGTDVLKWVTELDELPFAGVLVTAVEHEGRQAGPDVELVRAVASRARTPVLASGGIASLDDLRRLEEAGASEAVIGMALYTGALDTAAVHREFPWQH